MSSTTRRTSSGPRRADQADPGARRVRGATALTFENVRAYAITRTDLHDDVSGIGASMRLIRETRGGEWPSESVTEDDDYGDLVWHELEIPREQGDDAPEEPSRSSKT